MMKNVFWMTPMKVAAGFCVILAICAGLGALRMRGGSEAEPEVNRPVRTVGLESVSGEKTKRYFGTVQGARRVDLSFRVSGPLKQVLVEKGASVKKGDLLAAIDPRDFRTRLKQAQGAQAQAQAQYDDASANFRRYDNLYKQKIVAASTYDTYKAHLEVTRSALRSAQAQTAAAMDALKDVELYAPFDGIIADRMVENFQDVTAKQPVIRLQDISTLEIVFALPDNDVLLAPLPASADLKELVKDTQSYSMEARFDAVPSRAFPVRLKEFAAQADPNTKTYPVTVTMPQPGDVRILPGMAATVTVRFSTSEMSSDERYLVPATAILNEGGDRCFLWRFEEGQVHRVPVTTGGPHDGGMLEVSGPDLREGDRIVAVGVHFLRDGQRVHSMEETDR